MGFVVAQNLQKPSKVIDFVGLLIAVVCKVA
jgi:hypothetical protein